MSKSIRWTRRRWIGAGLAGLAVGALPQRARAATTLRWATVLPLNHPSVQMMEKVAKQVREQTGGTVEIQTFPAGQLGAKRAMRVIGSTYYGKRHVTSGQKPINTVEDMKGFKLRIPEVDTFRAMAEAWGARPTPL